MAMLKARACRSLWGDCGAFWGPVGETVASKEEREELLVRGEQCGKKAMQVWPGRRE